MKKFKILLVIMIGLLMIPFSTYAEEENVEETDKRVTVYFFYGDGCPHCAKFEEAFDNMKKDFGDSFKIIRYEVWKNEENSKLMDKILELKGEEENGGVPYVIVGDKAWIGYDETEIDEVVEAIKSEYKKDVEKRYDIMDFVNVPEKKNSTANDVVTLVLILIVVAGIIVGIVKTRKNVM